MDLFEPLVNENTSLTEVVYIQLNLRMRIIFIIVDYFYD